MLTKEDLLRPLAAVRTTEVVVTCMGVTRPWGLLSDHELDFASADSAMGHTADLALGIALAQPDRKVICLNGDGSMLMNLGTLVTITAAAAKNLVLFGVEPESLDIGLVESFATRSVWIARAAGFPRVYSFNRDVGYEATLPELLEAPGPIFVGVGMEPGSEGPISRSQREEARYLQTSLEHCSGEFRKAITRS